MIYECIRTNDVTEYCECPTSNNQLLIPNPPDGYMLADGRIVSCPIFGEWSWTTIQGGFRDDQERN